MGFLHLSTSNAKQKVNSHLAFLLHVESRNGAGPRIWQARCFMKTDCLYRTGLLVTLWPDVRRVSIISMFRWTGQVSLSKLESVLYQDRCRLGSRLTCQRQNNTGPILSSKNKPETSVSFIHIHVVVGLEQTRPGYVAVHDMITVAVAVRDHKLPTKSGKVGRSVHQGVAFC